MKERKKDLPVLRFRFLIETLRNDGGADDRYIQE